MNSTTVEKVDTVLATDLLTHIGNKMEYFS